MIIKSIKITNFRNYTDLNISFSPNINIIYGDNGQGKTNLLESIYVLGITKSHKLLIDNYLIKNNAKFARVSGIIQDELLSTKLEVILEQKRKQLKVDENLVRKASDYISKMSIIIFYPEDLELIKGSPSLRRRYLNVQLSQIHKNYLNVLNDYNKLLKQRNEMLKNFPKTKTMDNNYFEIITESLIDRGSRIYRYRDNYIKNINKNIDEIYESIMNIPKFNIIYKPIFNIKNFEINSLKNEFQEQLKKSRESELKIGMTLIGPHRDDFDFMINDLNLKTYGSQGQQRAAVLSLKLSEIPIFKSYKNTYPILLLDDVFSELDDSKKNNLLKYITNNIQTFITTTDLKSINQEVLKMANIIKIEKGQNVSKEEV
ncbi:MAG: DNA replication/repair protein RecF [Bacilli bacterium]|nr:DNA replication/repair protein RecF [Bacilli bacterium]MDD4547267.1 DNA replication/repair protein RecF [Bacilli bacterium]